MTKCHMCFDRVEAGLQPACSKACPTGALMFGDEKEIKKLAGQRLGAAKKRFGEKAQILDQDEVRVLYLVIDEFERYVTVNGFRC